MENLTQSSVNCTEEYYNNPTFVHIAIVGVACSSVSLLACFGAIFVVILFKKWQTFGQRLLTYLIVASSIASLGLAIRRVDFDADFTADDKRFCTFAAFFLQIAVWMELNAIAAVTLYLFLGVICSKFTGKYEVLYLLFIFVVPFTFGWIPFIHHSYGRAGAWCWIRLLDFHTCRRIVLGQVLQLAMYYVPHFVLLQLIILAYLFMFCKLSRKRKQRNTIIAADTSEQHTNKLVASKTAYLMVYPLIYFFLTLPIVITRIQNWARPQSPVVALWYVSAISLYLHGAAIVLAFVLESGTRRKLKWNHIRAAFRNYNSTKGVSEFTIGDREEPGGGEHKEVLYQRFTNDTIIEETLE